MSDPTQRSQNDTAQPRIPSLGVIGLLVLVALALAFWTWPQAERPVARPGTGFQSASWSVYFTQPGSSHPESGVVETALIEAIRSAESQIDLAVYSMRSYSLRDALLEAHNRGVDVRIVIETDNRWTPAVTTLEGAGIPLRTDERDYLMHHKFMVIDRKLVWIGSANFTFSGTHRENNSSLVVVSRELSADFETESEEMFLQDRFGQLSLMNTPFELVEVDGKVVEVLFAPEDGITQRLVQTINSARARVQVLAFILTSDPIAQALIDQAQRGREVQIVLEAENAGTHGSDYQELLRGGVQVRLDTNPFNMHHKVVIVDDRLVALGSFNFTQSAQELNDESMLIVHHPGVVEAYREEFVRLFAQALP